MTELTTLQKLWLEVYKKGLDLPTSFAEPGPTFFHNRAVMLADAAYDAFNERFNPLELTMARKLSPDQGCA